MRSEERVSNSILLQYFNAIIFFLAPRSSYLAPVLLIHFNFFFSHEIEMCYTLSHMPLKPSTKSSKNVLLILAMALFIVALSLVILSSLNPTQRKALSLTGNSYADGYNAARDQAMKLGLPSANIPTSIAAGKVTAVNGNSITVETNFFVDEKIDGVGNIRTVTLAKDGKVKIQTQISPSDYLKMQQEFQKTLQNSNGKDLPQPPSPFTSKDGSMSDIAVGDSISIQASTDLRLEKAISATEIDITRFAQLDVKK